MAVEKISCTIEEAIAATGLGRTKLMELILSGKIRSRLNGKRRLVYLPSLHEYMSGSDDQPKYDPHAAQRGQSIPAPEPGVIEIQLNSRSAAHG